MMARSKFSFHEIVRVISSKDNLKEIQNIEAPIIGMAEENGLWYYGLDVPDGLCSVDEHDIISTGKFANSEDYKSVGSISLRVLPDGSGEIINEDEKNSE